MYIEKTPWSSIKHFLIFAAVPLLAFTVVMMVPFVFGIVMAFTNWDGIATHFDFIGLANYQVALTNPEFWASLWLTFRFVFFTVICTNAIGFLLAVLVTSGFPGQNAFRIGFFTPNLIGGIILGFIWKFFFSRALVSVGAQLAIPLFQNSWLVDTGTAFWALVIVSTWKSAGYMMLIYIAGLMGVSKSVLEASRIDGCTGMQQMLRIKVPLVMQSFTICIFLSLQSAFTTYDINLALTEGGPYRTTELISMFVYNEAFKNQHYSVAQAMAFILFVVVAVIAVTQVSTTKRLEVRE